MASCALAASSSATSQEGQMIVETWQSVGGNIETLDLFAALAKMPALVSILLHRSRNEWREIVAEVEPLVYRPASR